MLEKEVKKRNVLTIIAIFAAIAEISGIVVLPFIGDTENQRIYLWYLIIFPSLLFFLFFLTLNFNHKVLYAPSDFQKENDSIHTLKYSSISDEIMKLKEITNELEINNSQVTLEINSLTPTQHIEIEHKHENDSDTLASVSKTDILSNYLLAEKLALLKIRQELEGELIKGVSFLTKEGKKITFNGLIRGNNKLILIDIEFIPETQLDEKGILYKINRVQSLIKDLRFETDPIFKFLCVFVLEVAISPKELAEVFYSLIESTHHPIEIKVFSTYELNKEFNL